MDETTRCPWVLKTWCWSLREVRAGDENTDADRIREGDRCWRAGRVLTALRSSLTPTFWGAGEGMRRKAEKGGQRGGRKARGDSIKLG